LTDYICFKIPDGSLNLRNCIGVIKDFCNSRSTISTPLLSGFLLRIPDEYECVDLSLYKVFPVATIEAILSFVQYFAYLTEETVHRINRWFYYSVGSPILKVLEDH
jgi:hypothetical protein